MKTECVVEATIWLVKTLTNGKKAFADWGPHKLERLTLVHLDDAAFQQVDNRVAGSNPLYVRRRALAALVRQDPSTVDSGLHTSL